EAGGLLAVTRQLYRTDRFRFAYGADVETRARPGRGHRKAAVGREPRRGGTASTECAFLVSSRVRRPARSWSGPEPAPSRSPVRAAAAAPAPDRAARRPADGALAPTTP